jgi:A/G-specific adenine glycosylase
MEFGALQCVPKNPNCNNCPFNNSCSALQKMQVNRLPFKSKKLKVKNRFFNYLIVFDANENTIIQKRTSKGIWHNLYEFPLIETEVAVDFEYIDKAIKESFLIDKTILNIIQYNHKLIVHKLSHQHLHIKFWKITIEEVLENAIDTELLKSFPFPIVIYNFIEKI